MSDSVDAMPAGARPTPGIVHKRSPLSLPETVDCLSEAMRAVGATLFVVIDHSGEAERVGLALRDTKLMIFGNPIAGTPVMAASPLAGIDLPLKVLVWVDDSGTVWMSYLSADWLVDRHAIPIGFEAALAVVEKLTNQVVE